MVALNLAISLVTVLSALLVRAGTRSLVYRSSERLLVRIILVFLVGIGTALVVEAFLPQSVPRLLPEIPYVRLGAAFLFELAVGVVSSLLGVAGGELIIPTLVFAFGVDTRTASGGSPS